MQISLVAPKSNASIQETLPANPLAQVLLQLGMDENTVVAAIIALWPVVNELLFERVALALGTSLDVDTIEQVAIERGFNDEQHTLLYEEMYKETTGRDFAMELTDIFQKFADKFIQLPQKVQELTSKFTQEDMKDEQVIQIITDYIYEMN